jgi:precorrin-2 methylase
MNTTIVASYGPFSIVRRDTILDGQGRPVGKNWAFLRNARKQAAHMAAKLEAGQTVALAVLGVQS